MARPRKTRYDAYDRKYTDHKHRCGPFTIKRENHAEWHVIDAKRGPFVLPKRWWELRAVG